MNAEIFEKVINYRPIGDKGWNSRIENVILPNYDCPENKGYAYVEWKTTEQYHPFHRL